MSDGVFISLSDGLGKTEVDNLYACDCSVIPDEWGLPPTLTLLGLGKRLGKHLSGDAMVA